MKYRAIAWVAAAVCMPSAYAVDVNWDSHATTETMTRTVAKNVTFMDDARYLLTPAQSGNTGVQAVFQLNSGAISNLRVDFYGDFYGPDRYLGSFTPTGAAGQQSFSFEHMTGRKKYYYLITGTTGAGAANYTLTSNLVPDSVFHAAVAPVPEPSTYAMFALGAVLLPVARRLRQKRSGGSAAAAGPNPSAACAA